MNGEYAWWFLIVGLCVGAAAVWFVRGSLAREEEDVSVREREVEAGWISRTIEDAGGIAPADLVAQVLALHRAYLREAEPFEVEQPDEQRPAAPVPAAVEGEPPVSEASRQARPTHDAAATERSPGTPGA